MGALREIIRPWQGRIRKGSMIFNEPWCFARGMCGWHFDERRTIVPIVSTMRSGSTLLKALLGEADDVSRLPETNYSHYRFVTQYSAYHRICRMSPRSRIVVLKRPSNYIVPFKASFLRAKIILLSRNIFDTCRSLHAMYERVRANESKRTPEALVDYWRDSYAKYFTYLDATDHEVRHVRYEDLLQDPVGVTSGLYEYIGSTRTAGSDRYTTPETYRWAWGNDDGGEKIKSLQVQKPAHRTTSDLDRTIERRIDSSEDVQRILIRLGYPRWRDEILEEHVARG